MTDTGLKYGTAAANDATVGVLLWVLPSNALGNNTTDGTAATCVATGFHQTQYLKIQITHGLATGDVPIGIVFAFRRFASDNDGFGTAKDYAIRAVKNGTTFGTNMSTGASYANGVGAWSSDFGGTSNLMGLTLVDTDTISFACACEMQSDAESAAVTAVRGTITYTPAGGGANQTKFFYALAG